MYYYSGYVRVHGIAVSRTVNLYLRSTGELVDTTTSSGTNGYFELETPYNSYHYATILPEVGDGYNIIAIDQILPQ